MNTFGDSLKEIRLGKGLSVREVAKRAKISHPYLSQLENGKRGVPTRETLYKLSEGLNAPLEELFTIAGYTDSITKVDTLAEAFGFDYLNIQQEIINKLKLLVDDTGEFYDYVKADVFKRIILNLYMAPAFDDSSDHKYYERNFTEFFSSSNEYTDSEIKEELNNFNQAYNLKTLIIGIKNETNPEKLELILNELVDIITEHNINPPRDITSDLEAYINEPRIHYKGHMLSEKEKNLLRTYLDVLISQKE